ncbi:MAG: hypothetical protein CGU28_13250 [Candidatus Dactylopiibacterium carminicum]|nr:MAG: hypothetical protein CGU28_13250 [Candidatus Dactylopiibacterium carminicum]
MIAVVNGKGGCGKSTLATHVASHLASLGEEVMLGDVDRQQSSRLWLALRPPTRPRIHGWSVDEKNFARPPAGMRHVVLDTPGGFHGFGLMKISSNAHGIIIPVTAGLFDKAAARESIQELRSMPRIASGRCRLACIGMRIDARTSQAESLRAWASEMGLPCLGAIRSAVAYNRCLESGLSLFDLPSERFEAQLGDWHQLVDWLAQLRAAEAPPPGSLLPTPQRSETLLRHV